MILYSILTLPLDMLYLTRDIWHRHLICYTWHLIHDTWYLTPVLDMLYLIPDPRPDTWHLRSDTGTRHVITWHLIPDTWCLTPVLDMLSLDTWHLIYGTWQLTCYHLILDTCFHMVLVHLTWCCDTWLDYYYTCITMSIHDYHFYRDLTWLL